MNIFSRKLYHTMNYSTSNFQLLLFKQQSLQVTQPELGHLPGSFHVCIAKILKVQSGIEQIYLWLFCFVLFSLDIGAAIASE